MSAQKELRELVKVIEERGFTVEPSGGGHQKIFYEGQPVNHGDPNDRSTWQPVLLPSSPSDPRWRDNTVAMLIRARVLDEDPFRAGQEGLTDEEKAERERAREERERRQQENEQARQAQSEEARDLAAETKVLHDRAKDVLDPIGVWRVPDTSLPPSERSKRSIGEASRLAFAVAQRQGVETPPSANAAYMTLRKLYDQSGNIRNGAFIEALLDELEAADDPVRHYFELLRDDLGVVEGGPAREPAEPVAAEPEPVGPEPLEIEAEDDERIRDLRSRLTSADSARRQAEEALRDEQAAREAAAATLNDLKAELDEARAEAASSNGAKIPELAFEVLGEMIGQYVTVAGEDGSASFEEVLETIEKKKEKAVELAKRVATLELGIVE